MKHCLVLLSLFAAAALLNACGQKGPLFLPGHAPESQTGGALGLDDEDEPKQVRENPEPERQVPDI